MKLSVLQENKIENIKYAVQMCPSHECLWTLRTAIHMQSTIYLGWKKTFSKQCLNVDRNIVCVPHTGSEIFRFVQVQFGNTSLYWSDHFSYHWTGRQHCSFHLPLICMGSTAVHSTRVYSKCEQYDEVREGVDQMFILNIVATLFRFPN